jgi:hypothetical protein
LQKAVIFAQIYCQKAKEGFFMTSSHNCFIKTGKKSGDLIERKQDIILVFGGFQQQYFTNQPIYFYFAPFVSSKLSI